MSADIAMIVVIIIGVSLVGLALCWLWRAFLAVFCPAENERVRRPARVVYYSLYCDTRKLWLASTLSGRWYWQDDIAKAEHFSRWNLLAWCLIQHDASCHGRTAHRMPVKDVMVCDSCLGLQVKRLYATGGKVLTEVPCKVCHGKGEVEAR